MLPPRIRPHHIQYQLSQVTPPPLREQGGFNTIYTTVFAFSQQNLFKKKIFFYWNDYDRGKVSFLVFLQAQGVVLHLQIKTFITTVLLQQVIVVRVVAQQSTLWSAQVSLSARFPKFVLTATTLHYMLYKHTHLIINSSQSRVQGRACNARIRNMMWGTRLQTFIRWQSDGGILYIITSNAIMHCQQTLMGSVSRHFTTMNT